ncbi:MAG: metallophosphoesterase [Treponema sp.]|nr:metallophosphoesterase [Treponema sp.]
MKIIHCADIHADSKMGTHFSKEKADERRNEIVNTFAKMVTFAKENDVKVIIIAGDLFDTKTSQQKTIKKRIAYIISQNPEIDFLYLRGNHDEDVEFADADLMPNLKSFTKERWTSYSYGNVEVYGHEFGKTIPLSAYSEVSFDSKKVNIVVLHGQVAEYKAKEGAPVISLPKFVNQNIDYIALGHIHDYKKEKLDARCFWCYSGCLEGRGFDECGEKGFVLLNIENNQVESRFVSLAERRIHEVEVRLDGAMNYNEIMQAVTAKLAGISSRDIVEVNLTGEVSEETEIETQSYEAALSSNYYLIRFKDKTETKINYEKYENDVSLKGEFIRLVKGQSDLSEDEKSKIIMTGIKALARRVN